MICVPTVQHTGSLFVVEHLFGGRHNVCFAHFGQRAFQKMYEHAEKGNCIIPLRELDEIAYSWSGRQKDPKDLDRDLQLMIEFSKEYDPYFLPIDHPERQAFLDEINKAFNLDLKTDWPRINTKKHHHCGDDFSIVFRHQWFFDLIYQ